MKCQNFKCQNDAVSGIFLAVSMTVKGPEPLIPPDDAPVALRHVDLCASCMKLVTVPVPPLPA